MSTPCFCRLGGIFFEHYFPIFVKIRILSCETNLRPEIERATTLAKKALLYFGPFGLAAYLNGTTFIDRSRGAESRKILDETITKGCVYVT